MSSRVRYLHSELAFNYRITNLQSALGLAQLEQIETFVQKKRQIFDWYREQLQNVRGIAMNIERPNYRNTYWMISVVLDENVKILRDELCANLRNKGVDTRPFFVPMSELPHLSKFRTAGVSSPDTPVTKRLSKQGFNLPSGCGLTRTQVLRVCHELRTALKQ